MGLSLTMLEPATAEEVVSTIADARAQAAPLEIRGGGSVLDRLPRGDEAILSTAALTGVVSHAAQDLTVTVRAGTPLDELAALLAAAGQECPIDAGGGAGSTVGGRIASALAGPRQLGAGRVRDWVLRVRFVTGAGDLAKAGGVTVKDVTGYDLCRLLTGSWGTIGVITEVTLKVRPIPPHQAWYVTEEPRSDLDAVLYRPVGLITTQDRTHVLLEGHAEDAAAEASSAGLRAGDAPILPTRARASVDPAQLGTLTQALTELGCTWAAQDGVGVCHLDGDVGTIGAARAAVEQRGGSLLVLDPELGLPAFGHRPDRGPIEQRVTAALDPDDVLAPWRWTR